MPFWIRLWSAIRAGSRPARYRFCNVPIDDSPMSVSNRMFYGCGPERDGLRRDKPLESDIHREVFLNVKRQQAICEAGPPKSSMLGHSCWTLIHLQLTLWEEIVVVSNLAT